MSDVELLTTPNPATTPWVPLWDLGAPAGDMLRYQGQYLVGTNYNEGDIVVSGGVAYMAVRPTSAAPVAWPYLGTVPNAQTKLWDSITAGVVLPAASITTPALAQTFTNLIIEIVCRTDKASGNDFLNVRPNGDATASYREAEVHAASGGTLSGAGLGGANSGFALWVNDAVSAAGGMGGATVKILNYTDATKNRRLQAVGGFNDGASEYVSVASANWGNALAPVTTLNFSAGGLIQPGSRFTVYAD